MIKVDFQQRDLTEFLSEAVEWSLCVCVCDMLQCGVVTHSSLLKVPLKTTSKHHHAES